MLHTVLQLGRLCKAQQGSEVMATTGIEGWGDQRARAGVWKGFPLSMD